MAVLAIVLTQLASQQVGWHHRASKYHPGLPFHPTWHLLNMSGIRKDVIQIVKLLEASLVLIRDNVP